MSIDNEQAAPYDAIIIGAGIAGLWLANVLKRAGFNVLVFEKGTVGGMQTLASQGMIHGGQKYAIGGAAAAHALNISSMPERWEASLGGFGDIDLTDTAFLSETQVMWPAGGMLSEAALFGAARLVNAKTKKLKSRDFPEALAARPKFKGPVYALPEKVLDIKSLLRALMRNLQGRVLQGAAEEIMPDGQVAIGGRAYRAQMVIFTAGLGNEEAFRMLNITRRHAQRRPLRQLMVRPLPAPLFGHGIAGNPKPRVTVTAAPLPYGIAEIESQQYVWYLGGALAEAAAGMTEDEAIAHAQKEMAEMFPHIDWRAREWASWLGDRAEPFDEKGDLPPGPHIEQRGRIFIAWPAKLTFAPALADRIMEFVRARNVTPLFKTAPPDAPAAVIGSYPWELAAWKKLP